MSMSLICVNGFAEVCGGVGLIVVINRMLSSTSFAQDTTLFECDAILFCVPMCANKRRVVG